MADKSKGSKDSKGKGKPQVKQGGLFDDVKVGNEGEDGFAPVYDPEGGETWQYKEPGDEVQGIYFDHFVNTGGEYGDSNCYKVFNPDSESIHLCWGTFVLDKFMSNIKPGTFVRITYKGKAGRAHNFQVAVSKALTTQYASAAKALVEKAEAKRKGGEEGGEGGESVPF